LNLKEYEYIWTTNREEYVLVKMKRGGYAIFNRLDKTALIIEDDEIYEEVVMKLLKNNCEILDSVR
jgi:hypothetical protein